MGSNARVDLLWKMEKHPIEWCCHEPDDSKSLGGGERTFHFYFWSKSSKLILNSKLKQNLENVFYLPVAKKLLKFVVTPFVFPYRYDFWNQDFFQLWALLCYCFTSQLRNGFFFLFLLLYPWFCFSLFKSHGKTVPSSRTHFMNWQH